MSAKVFSLISWFLICAIALPVAAQDNASSRRKDGPSIKFDTPPNAASPAPGSDRSDSSTTQIPANLLYLFDLPWCARWQFTCISCEKNAGNIECINRRNSCEEHFRYYHCERYSPPKGCIAWVDGCNFCSNGSCTLKPCQEYLAPNEPSFECRRYQTDK